MIYISKHHVYTFCIYLCLAEVLLSNILILEREHRYHSGSNIYLPSLKSKFDTRSF